MVQDCPCEHTQLGRVRQATGRCWCWYTYTTLFFKVYHSPFPHLSRAIPSTAVAYYRMVIHGRFSAHGAQVMFQETAREVAALADRLNVDPVLP